MSIAPETQTNAGKNVLVAGATGAFGWAMSKLLAETGATVILAGRSVKALERRYDELVAAGAATPAIYPIDFTGAQGKDYFDLADQLQEQLGGIDALIWAVGFWHGMEPSTNLQAENWFKTLHLNLTAPQLLLQACTESLRQRHGVALFPLQSPAVTQLAFTGAYGASQAGLRNWVISVADELERFGPRVIGLELPPLKSRLRLAAFPAEAADKLVDAAALSKRVLAALTNAQSGLTAIA